MGRRAFERLMRCGSQQPRHEHENVALIIGTFSNIRQHSRPSSLMRTERDACLRKIIDMYLYLNYICYKYT